MSKLCDQIDLKLCKGPEQFSSGCIVVSSFNFGTVYVYFMTGKRYYSLFEFPKDATVASNWTDFCSRLDPLPKRPSICEVHFHPRDIVQAGTL